MEERQEVRKYMQDEARAIINLLYNNYGLKNKETGEYARFFSLNVAEGLAHVNGEPISIWEMLDTYEVVPLCNYPSIDKIPYAALKYAGGQDLQDFTCIRDYIRDDGLTLTEGLRYTIQIGEDENSLHILNTEPKNNVISFTELKSFFNLRYLLVGASNYVNKLGVVLSAHKFTREEFDEWCEDNVCMFICASQYQNYPVGYLLSKDDALDACPDWQELKQHFNIVLLGGYAAPETVPVEAIEAYMENGGEITCTERIVIGTEGSTYDENRVFNVGDKATIDDCEDVYLHYMNFDLSSLVI